MKNHIQRLHHVGMPTTNIKGTVDFYQSFGGEILFEKMDEDEGKPIKVVLLRFCDITIEIYERTKITEKPGAIDHLAFEVKDIETLFDVAVKQGYTLMAECKEKIQISTYWPARTQWFIVIGVNNEKIEFCQEMSLK